MTTLRLFGLDLEVVGSAVAQPAGEFIDVHHWSAKLSPSANGTFDLSVDAHIVWKGSASISARLTIRYRGDGDRYLVCSDQPGQGANARFGYWTRAVDSFPSGGILQMESGLVRIRLNDLEDRLRGVGDDISVSFTKARAFSVSSAKLPLSAGTGDGGITIDLRNGELITNPGMFFCETFALRRIRRGNRVMPQAFFKRIHDSVRQKFDLSVGLMRPVLSFVPGRQRAKDVEFVPLQTDVLSRKLGGAYSEDNPVVVPLGLSDYMLNLSLTEVDGRPVLNRIFASARKATGGTVKTFAVGQRKTNAPSVLRFDGELDLAVRLDAWDSPSTLMVAPFYGSVGPEGRDPLSVERLGDRAIHGIVSDAVFFSSPNCSLVCSGSTAGAHVDPGVDGVEQELVFDVTLPTLVAESAPEIHYPRPGQIYAKGSIEPSSNSAVDNWRFRATGPSPELVLPLMPLSMVEAAGVEVSDVGGQYLKEANRRTSIGFTHSIEDVQHETFMREAAALNDTRKIIELSELYVADPDSGELTVATASGEASGIATEAPARPDDRRAMRRTGLKVKEHPIARDYGPIRVAHLTPKDSQPDYFVLRKLDDVDRIEQFPKTDELASILIPGMPQFRIGSPPRVETHPEVNRPIGILKLSANLSLDEIFESENVSTEMPDLPGQNFLTDIVAQPIRERGWIGLFLFNMDLNLDEFPILQTIVGESELKIRYLATSAEKSAGTSADRAFSYSGRVRWSNPNPPEAPDPPGNAEEQRTFESTFTAREIDVAWHDNQLTRFHAESDVEFRSAAGIGNQQRAQKKIELKIIGSYDKTEDKFRFLGQLAEKIPIITTQNGLGPLKQIYVKHAELVRSRGRSVIDLDGEVDCRPIEFGGEKWIDYPSGDTRRISFRGLGLEFPAEVAGGKVPQWLKFNYPSFKLDPNMPQFNLFGLDWLQMKVQNIGVDVGDRFNWGGLSDIHRSRNDDRIFEHGALVTDIRLRFGKLPDLIAKNIKELTLDFSVGYGFGGKSLPHLDASRLRIALRAVGFDKLNLDLMRFLVLEADRLEFGVKEIGGQNVGKMDLVGLRVKILEAQIIDGLTLHMYGMPDRKKAILSYYGPGDSVFRTGLLDIYWLLVGRNLMLPDQLVKDVLSVDAKSNGEDQKKVAGVLNQAVKDDKILPIGGAGGRANVGEWLFGAGFGFFDGFVIGKFLFQDKAYYGIAMRGAFLEEWFGYDLAISVVYFKRARPEEDSFFIQVRVPAVDFATFRFTGGVIALEVFVNGGFVLDVGFPWIDQYGSRRWDRALGAFILPFQGSGGFYLGYRKSTVIKDPRTGSETQLIQAVGGYAVQGGLGASFNGGLFRVWVRAGIYYIIEGGLVLHDKNIRGLRLVGAVGILVEGAGELNWWIISVRIGVLASAEARATLIWGMDPDALRLEDLSNSDVILYLDFVLHARASARACIGSGPFKICKGVSASVTMPFRQKLRLK